MADGNENTGRALIVGGSRVTAIVPQDFDSAWRIAQALSASGMTPFKQPEQALAAILAGAELGLTPFAALNSIAMINGRATVYGDGLLAIVINAGVKVHEAMEGEGTDKAVAICRVQRPGSSEVVERRFSVADAAKAKLLGKEGPWQNYRDRMLRMRARSWALRDSCADLLRGFRMTEEVQDYEVISNEPVPQIDQRPPEEIGEMPDRKATVVGPFLKGPKAVQAAEFVAKSMVEAPDLETLEAIWQRDGVTLNVSENRRHWLLEQYLCAKEALESPPAEIVATTTQSTFEKLKEAGLEIVTLESGQADAFAVWKGSLTPDALAEMTDDERKELATIYASVRDHLAGAGK